MTDLEMPSKHGCDVLIAGAGLAGLTSALGFARAGFNVVCCGASERTGGGRTVALLDRSLAYLKSLDFCAPLRARASPLRALRLIDDAGGLFPPRPVEFHASEIGLEAFGWNIENDLMAGALRSEIASSSAVERIAAGVAAYDFSPGAVRARLGGRTISARLVIGADGQNSPARRAADLEARTHRYPQSALTAILAHKLPHNDFSTEFHTAHGPLTLVPLPANETAPHRSSLVWMMSEKEARRRGRLDDQALAHEIESQARSMLGAMRLEGERGVFPLARRVVPKITAHRLALIGDAAHAIPPIGAQGLNLGLRDVEAIVACAVEARATGRDIGGRETLSVYERARRADIATRTALVDGLNRALLARFQPIDFARGAGLAALGAIAPLRRFVMREGVAPRFARRLP